MNQLDRLENALEDIFEGRLSQFLGGRLHPIEIATLLGKALDDGQSPAPGGFSVAPNRFFVFVHPRDYEMIRPHIDVLQDQFAMYLMHLATDTGLRVIGSLRVTVQPMPSIPESRARVSAYLDAPGNESLLSGNTEPITTN